MKKYDLVIIGGGAGAFAAAIKANELGAKTAMVNAGLPLGGTCVNVGCVPSKALLHAGEILHNAKNHNIPGLELNVKSFNFNKIIQDEISLVERMRREKYEKILKLLENVELIEGKAKFISKKEVEVNGKVLVADKFIIASGSTARVPNIKGIREVGFITHIEALKLKKQPKKLIVVGAGPVGLEFAQIFSRFGTKVTILQSRSSIFPPAEKEITDRLAKILTKEGITIKTGVKVKSARKDGNKKVLVYEQAGLSAEVVVSAEEILLAAGKIPNTKELGLDKVGVETNKREAVIVKKTFETSKPHIFAVGDVTNLPFRLETTAGSEGTLAAENILKGVKKNIDYNAVPYTIFTDPQLASVGFTEDEQMRKTGVCACRTVSFKDIPKAIILRRTEGLIKMGIDPKTRQILGVHILAPQAGELIAEAMMLVKNKNTIDDVTNSLPMFPTLSESIKLVAMSFTKDISKLSCCV